MTSATEREITAADGTTWRCVQAFAGLGGTSAAGEAAAERLAEGEGTVAVVCTPSGGAMSVRLSLPKGWATMLDDDALVRAIADERAARPEG